MERIRKIHFHKEYFNDFYEGQPEKIKDKIEYVLFLISAAQRIPTKFLKHIENTDGLYEVRVAFGGNIYRIFSCFDEGDLVVLFNGFQKKSQRIPVGEIVRALKIKAEYFNEKASAKTNGSNK